MNGTISGQSEFDEVVVSTSALTHLVKSRPKNPGRRPPAHRSRGALVSSPTSDISSFGDDADSGVGASSELLATHSTVHKSDGEICEDIIEQSPTSQESAGRASSNECLVDADDTKPPKSEKISTLQRLKKQKKSESKNAKQEKSGSFITRLGSRISRALSRSQSHEEPTERTEKPSEERVNGTDARKDEPEIERIKEEGVEEDVRVSQARDTFYAMPPSTKTGHDKVILELAAIAQNAKLVAAKAEALKSARLQGDGDSSGEESSGTGKALSRRDSEKNIEQAAENLRTTLQNLSEAELLEINKQDDADDDIDTNKEGKVGPATAAKPPTAAKPKMNVAMISEMEGLFANKAQLKRGGSEEKKLDKDTADNESQELADVNKKDDAVFETVDDARSDDGLDSTKKDELEDKVDEKENDETVKKEESEKEPSKTDEQSEEKTNESEECKNDIEEKEENSDKKTEDEKVEKRIEKDEENEKEKTSESKDCASGEEENKDDGYDGDSNETNENQTDNDKSSK